MGPRLGRWDISGDPPMGSPTNACIGLFMLWWGWMAFNAGSTFGISGRKWILAAKATCTTMVSSFAGGIFAIFYSLYVTNGKLDILMLINGILGALVGVTGGCAIVTPREAVFIGIIGSFLANITAPLLIWLKIDDAVGATCVHGPVLLPQNVFGQEDKVLWLAALDGDEDTVKAAVNGGVTSRLANENGLTLLHAAAMGGHLALVKFLVENGAGVDRKKVKGETPLFIASANGRVEVVRYLLEQGATVDKPDDDKWTPLHIASYHGHLGVVRLLVENGADVNLDVDEGATPILFASQNGHTEVVEYLLEKGANPNNYDNVRRTPLHMAALNGHKSVAQVLLKAGARTNIRDGNGMTPKAAALSSGNTDLANIL